MLWTIFAILLVLWLVGLGDYVCGPLHLPFCANDWRSPLTHYTSKHSLPMDSVKLKDE